MVYLEIELRINRIITNALDKFEDDRNAVVIEVQEVQPWSEQRTTEAGRTASVASNMIKFLFDRIGTWDEMRKNVFELVYTVVEKKGIYDEMCDVVDGALGQAVKRGGVFKIFKMPNMKLALGNIERREQAIQKRLSGLAKKAETDHQKQERRKMSAKRKKVFF